jgi:hypothetical protein
VLTCAWSKRLDFIPNIAHLTKGISLHISFLLLPIISRLIGILKSHSVSTLTSCDFGCEPPNTQFDGIFSVYTALSHFRELSP